MIGVKKLANRHQYIFISNDVSFLGHILQCSLNDLAVVTTLSRGLSYGRRPYNQL